MYGFKIEIESSNELKGYAYGTDLTVSNLHVVIVYNAMYKIMFHICTQLFATKKYQILFITNTIIYKNAR